MRFSIPFKLAAGALLLAASTGAFAQDIDFKNEAPPCPCPPSLMDGFYVGAEVSYDVITTHADFDFTDEFSVSGNPHLAARGWDGGLFLGFGRYFTDIFYIGAEVFGYWSGANEDFTIYRPGPLGGYIHANIESNGSYGVALLPGLKINQTTLAYLRLGYLWSNIHGNGNYHFNTLTPPFPRNRSFSGNNTVSGWEFGIGMETLLVDNWSLRADYTYVDYNNSNNHNDNRLLNHWSPRGNIFTAGIVYHIAM